MKKIEGIDRVEKELWNMMKRAKSDKKYQEAEHFGS
jgi:hypothetical protein